MYDLAFCIVAIWPILGLYIDGWSHNTRPVTESFFTPWHGILYSGVLVVIAVLAFRMWLSAAEDTSKEADQVTEDPYRISMFGAILFLVSGGFDLAWHESWGVEVSLDALVSTPHLGLFAGGALVISGPIRSVLARSDGYRFDWIIVSMSSALLLSVISFASQFANPLVLPVARADFRPSPTEAQEFFRQAVGLSAVILSSATLSIALRSLVRIIRYRPGSISLVVVLSGAPLTILREEFLLLPFVIAAGVTIDVVWSLVYRLIEPARQLLFLGIFAPSVYFSIYFSYIGLIDGIWWPTNLWLGSIVMAGAVGWLATAVDLGPANHKQEREHVRYGS